MGTYCFSWCEYSFTLAGVVVVSIIILTEVSPHMTCFCFSPKGAHFTELISVPSVVNGIKGEPLYVPVGKKFNEDGVQFQGTWYQISPKSTHLVTFDNNVVIHSMVLKETVERITPPNISLKFTCLEEADEGDYQLTIHITHTDHNESETVIKNVRITVNGKNGYTSLIWQMTCSCHFFFSSTSSSGFIHNPMGIRQLFLFCFVFVTVQVKS